MRSSAAMRLSTLFLLTLLVGCGSSAPTSQEDPKPIATPPKTKADIYSKNEIEALEAFNSGYRLNHTATNYALSIANDIHVVASVRRIALDRVKAKYSVSLADETSALDNNSEWLVYDSLYPILSQRLTPLLPSESKDIIVKNESSAKLAAFSVIQRDPMSMEMALASRDLVIEGLEKKWFRHRFIYQAVMNRESIDAKYVTEFEIFKSIISLLKSEIIEDLEKDILGNRQISKSKEQLGRTNKIQPNTSSKEIAKVTHDNRQISRGEIEILSLLVNQAPQLDTSKLVVKMLGGDISWLVPNLFLGENSQATPTMESLLEFNRQHSLDIVKSLPYSPDLITVYGLILAIDESSKAWALAKFKESVLAYVKTALESKEDKLNLPQESGIFIREIEFTRQPQVIFWLLDSIQTFCPYATKEIACLTTGAQMIADSLITLNDVEYSAIAPEALLFSLGSSYVDREIQDVKIKLLARALSIKPATLRAAEWKFGPAVTSRKLSLFPYHITEFGFASSSHRDSMSEVLMELGIEFVNRYSDLISIGELALSDPNSGRIDRSDREIWNEGVFRAVSLGQDPVVIAGLTYSSQFPEYFRDARRLEIIRGIAKDANRSDECRRAAEVALKKLQNH